MPAKLFYDLINSSAFSSLANLQTAIKEAKGKIFPLEEREAWLERQEVYTLHKPARKHFPRNPYTVTNVVEVRESDLLDVRNISKFNNNYKYLLTENDVFSKFLHVVPLKSKTAQTVTSIHLY